MKTKRLLGIFLALMQVLLLASVPLCIAAEESTNTVENEDGSLNIYQLDDGVTVEIDGKASASELWDLIPWTTSAFKLAEKSGADDTHTLQADYSAKMKLMWQKKDGKAFLYALVEVDDKTLNGLENNWTSDGFTIMIDEKAEGTKESKQLNTAAIYVPERTDGVGYTGKDQLEYKVNDRRAEQGRYTLEFRYAFTDAANCADTIKFDIVLVDNLAKSSSDGNRYAKYSWGGAQNNQVPAKAVGVICNKKVSELQSADPVTADVILMRGPVRVDALNAVDGAVTLPNCETDETFLGWSDPESEKLYPAGYSLTVGNEPLTLYAVIVSFQTVAGASIKIDVDTAIRFCVEITSGWQTASAYISEKGVLLADAAKLTAALTNDGSLTEEELKAANVPFEKKVATETVENGTAVQYDGILDHVTSKEQAFAASGYLKVGYADGTSGAFYTRFSETDHIRSVSDVAEKAYADRINLNKVVNGVSYCFKVTKNYAVGSFTAFSYSPYTADQLDILKSFYQVS